MGRLTDRSLKNIFFRSIAVFEQAGFKVKDVYFDQYEKAVEMRDEKVRRQKADLESGAFKNSELGMLMDKIDNFLAEGLAPDERPSYYDMIDKIPYHFQTPYVEFEYPDEGILIALLSNNLPPVVEMQIMNHIEDKDYPATSNDTYFMQHDEYCDYKLFKNNHTNTKPHIYLSLLSPAVDIYDADNYADFRENFFLSIERLANVVLQGAMQWKAALEAIDIFDDMSSKTRKKGNDNGN
ncbi:MAG: hypothetical protein IKR19_07765 [Acholeplasmatales bacterium]|nr:hypothetical protein [Acholeplasmatales bacterium]